MTALGLLLRTTRQRTWALGRTVPAPDRRAQGGGRRRRRGSPTRHDVQLPRTVAGFPCWTVAPARRATGRAALFLHGGGYVVRAIARSTGR